MPYLGREIIEGGCDGMSEITAERDTQIGE